MNVRVVDMRWVKPLDEDAIREAAETGFVVTVENGIISGGVGEGVLEVLSKEKMQVRTLTLGINDRTVPHGSQDLLLADLGLDAAGIAASIRDALGK